MNTEVIAQHVNAKAIMLIEAETGKVIYEKNSKEPLPIASMSKLMTQYLVLNAIQKRDFIMGKYIRAK